MIKVAIVNNQTDARVSLRLKALIRRAVRTALIAEGVSRGDVTALLCGEDEIRLLNRTYRNIDAVTDVLSFPMDREGKAPHLGDMALCVKRAAEQGEAFGHGLFRECAYLAAHSALHLVGYDHEDEAARAVMRQKEEAVMDRLGLHRD